MQRLIEKTADGSVTIYLPELDEHYHSVKGALVESQHIYRDSAFVHRLGSDPHRTVLNVLEIGFGTGLNAVVTAMVQTPGVTVNYHSVELYPVKPDEVCLLNYGELTDAALFAQLHAAPWGEGVKITDTFTIYKICDSFLTMTLPTDIDVVYFDAFAPEKQPEMWSEHLLRKVYDAMREGGVLTTYCAKGAIRRMLASIGFSVERLPGPKDGKREILRATK